MNEIVVGSPISVSAHEAQHFESTSRCDFSKISLPKAVDTMRRKAMRFAALAMACTALM